MQPDLLFEEGHLAQPGTPAGRYVSTPTGSFISLDATAIQAATVYAHIERLHKLDVSSGASEFLPPRASIGLNVGITTTDNLRIENNAQYNPTLDAFLFVPYTDTDLPIVFNAGVIAHEHFHSIFQHIVLKGMQISKAYLSANIDEPNKLPPPTQATQTFAHDTGSPISIDQYNRYVLRGINEGLADFWGWLYSGDESFVGRSLVNSLETRRLDRGSVQFYDSDFFKLALGRNTNDQTRLSMAYFLGSQYAVYFRNITLKIFNGKSDPETRAKMARILILSLPNFKDELLAKLDSQYLAPEIFVKSFMKSLQANSNAPSLKDLDVCKSFREIAPLAIESSKPESCAMGTPFK